MPSSESMNMSDDPESEVIDSASFTPLQVAQNSRFGMMRTCSSLNCMEVCFLLSSVISLLATLGLTIYTLALMTYIKNNADFFFAVIIIVNLLFCLYYAIYGIYWERPFEILVFLIAIVIFVTYLIVNFVSQQGWDSGIKIGRLVVASVLAPLCGSLGFIIAKDFHVQNNLIVRTVGAASEFATACRLLFTFQAALKLDMQMGISFLVLIFAKPIKTPEIVLLAIGAPCILIWFVLGMFGTRYEQRWVMWIFFPLGVVCGPAYIVYRIYLAAKDLNRSAGGAGGGNSNPNDPTRDPFLHYISIVTVACASLFLFARMVALILSVLIYRNFGRGLKQKLDSPASSARADNDVRRRFARM